MDWFVTLRLVCASNPSEEKPFSQILLTLSWPLAPGRRWRFPSCAIDWMLFQHAHRFLHCAFELWISSGNHFFGPVLDVDVRRDPFVLNCPSPIAREKPAARSDHRTAIDERRCIGCMDQTAPGSLTHQ